MHREITSKGYYNGLNIPKEENDYCLTLIKIFDPYIVHFYYNHDGILKGIYVNINTPVELIDINTFRYYDLEVDIIKKPNEEPVIIDYEKFKSYIEDGIIPITYGKEIDRLLNKLLQKLKEKEITTPEQFYEIV